MLSPLAFVCSRFCVCYEVMNNSLVLQMYAFNLCRAFEVCLCIRFRFLDVFFGVLVGVSYVCS